VLAASGPHWCGGKRFTQPIGIWCIDLKIFKKKQEKITRPKVKKENKKDQKNSAQQYLFGQEPGLSQVTARCQQNTAIGSKQEPGHSQVTFKCKKQKTAIRSKQEPGISQVTTKFHKKDKNGKTSLTFPSGWSWLLLCWCCCLPAAHASLTSCSSHLVAYTSLNGSLPVAMGSDAMELWNDTCDLLLPSSPAYAAAGDVLMHFDEPWQSFGILALEVFPLFSPELPCTWLFCAATSLLSWLIGRKRKRKRNKKHVKPGAHLKKKKQRTRKVRVLHICRFAGCTRVRAPRLICRRKRMKLWFRRRSFRFSVPWKKQSPNVCESRHPGPGWAHFSKRYLDLILSPVLAGGASATWGFRRKRNRKVTAQNQANEFTRDIIALLKSCLNQGTSPDQLWNAVQKCAGSNSISASRTSKQKKKKLVGAKVPASKSQPLEWVDKNGKVWTYTVDDSGWWKWSQEPWSYNKSDTSNWQGRASAPEWDPVAPVAVGRDNKWISEVRIADWDQVAPPKLVSFPKKN